MSVEQSKPTASSVFWSANQSAGWIYLLPPLASRHVLCIDPPIEITWLLEHSCREVTIAYTSERSAFDAGWSSRELVLERVRWVPLTELLQGVSIQISATNSFDGLVIHDPQARVIHSGTIGTLERLMSAIPRLLSPDAFVYLGLRRRYSLFRSHKDSHALAGPRPLVSLSLFASRLRNCGLPNVCRYPFLLEVSRVTEVLIGNYRATTNGESLRERAKEYLLCGRGAQLFAPAYGYFARGPATSPTVIENVTQVVANALQIPPQRLQSVYCRLMLGDKAILAFEDRERRAEPAVAVVSADPKITRGRRIEASVLARLARMPARISQWVPRHVGEFAVGRYRCFVMTMLPGVTLDSASESLRSLTRQALDFIETLHVETAAPALLNLVGFERHVGMLVDAALGRNPGLSTSLLALRKALRETLGGYTLPTVFTHGDFKIENVMYSRADHRMTGVIDWEHADDAALPLIDPLYLMFYNRTLRGSTWIEVLESIVCYECLDPFESECIDAYLSRLGVDITRFTPLAAIFLVHHIGRRVTLSVDTETQERLRRIIENLADRLARESVGMDAYSG